MAKSANKTDPVVVELKIATTGASRLEGREGILWILACGVMLFIGIVKGINLVIVLAYVLFGLWAINFFLARRAVRGISARRPTRPPVIAGVPAEWALEISESGKPVGNWVLEERSGESVAAWMVFRAEQASFRPRVRATFSRRGKHVLAPLVARSSYPFGLFSQSVTLLPGEDLIVLPKPARVDGERLRSWMFRAWIGREAEIRKHRRVVDREAEIHGLRDYRLGDSPRRIHWKATARRNRLTVREYEDAAPPRLLLVLDAWLPGDPTKEDQSLLELAISLAAGVIREWRREPGARLALVLAGANPVILDGPPGSGVTQRMLEALALEPGGDAENISTTLGALSPASRAAPILVLSSRKNSPTVTQVRRELDRPIAFACPMQPEPWFQLT